MNIQEDYVSFETAKLLKEKRFDEPCECLYDTENYVIIDSYAHFYGICVQIVEKVNDDTIIDTLKSNNYDRN